MGLDVSCLGVRGQVLARLASCFLSLQFERLAGVALRRRADRPAQPLTSITDKLPIMASVSP